MSDKQEGTRDSSSQNKYLEHRKLMRNLDRGRGSESSDNTNAGMAQPVEHAFTVEQQMKMNVEAKGKSANKRRGELFEGPSVAMTVHAKRMAKNSGNNKTRLFRKIVPQFGSKLLRPKKKPSLTQEQYDEPQGQGEETHFDLVKPPVKKTLEETDFIKSALDKLILFNHIPPSTKQNLAEAFELRFYKKGSVICRQGEYGDEMFVILSGEVEVRDESKEENEVEIVLKTGHCFGELGMHFGCERMRTITTISDSHLFALKRQTFAREVENAHYRKAELTEEALAKVKILDKLSAEQKARLANYCFTVSFAPGDRIIEKGTLGGTFYMIIKGKVNAIVYEEGEKKTSDATEKPFGGSKSVLEIEPDTDDESNVDPAKRRKQVYEFSEGQYFGERALFQNDYKRAADVIAKTHVEALVITYETFAAELNGLTQALKDNIRKQALEETPFFDNLSAEETLGIQEAMVLETFEEGENIINQGAENEKFYIIQAGQVEVSNKVGNTTVQIAHLQEDSYFGEGSILSKKEANATVTALTNVTCLVLSRTDFDRLISKEKLKHLREHYQQRVRKLSTRNREETNLMLSKVTFESLDILGTLGSGCFGLVKLCCVPEVKSYYALKMLEKGTVVKNNQELNVLNEKNILLQCDHPFIVRLYRTFKDKYNLYFLMEFVQGGEMFQFLHYERNGHLDNDTARFHVACVVDALDFLHQKKIAYRDLKPENLMIDSDGYAKMVDFGFAKRLVDKTFTMCGTAQYLAPEILQNRGYGRSVDYWTLGILIYELFTGTTPFKRKDRNELFRMIKHENRIKFNRRWRGADEAKELVCLLLHKHPHKRLGSRMGGNRGFSEVKDHAWFKIIDFDKLYFKEITPPWLPEIRSPGSTMHFEEYDEAENPITGKYKDRAGSASKWEDF